MLGLLVGLCLCSQPPCSASGNNKRNSKNPSVFRSGLALQTAFRVCWRHGSCILTLRGCCVLVAWLRRVLGAQSFMGQTKLCRPGSHAYDEKVAKELWEESAARAGVPVQPQA